jgi:hypothetical protein
MLYDTLEMDKSLQYGPYVFGGDRIRRTCAEAMRAAQERALSELSVREHSVRQASHGRSHGPGHGPSHESGHVTRPSETHSRFATRTNCGNDSGAWGGGRGGGGGGEEGEEQRASEFGKESATLKGGVGGGVGGWEGGAKRQRRYRERSDVRLGFGGSSMHLDGMGTLTAIGGVKSGTKMVTAVEACDAPLAFYLAKFKLYAKPGGSAHLINDPIDRAVLDDDRVLFFDEITSSVKEVSGCGTACAWGNRELIFTLLST